METLKKYLPFIILGIVGIVVLRIAGRSKATILPQTQLLETPYTDPNAQLRLPAFQALAQVAGAQIESERDIELASIARDTEASRISSSFQLGQGELGNQLTLGLANLQNQLRQIDILETLGLRSEETELAKVGLQTELAKYLQEREFGFKELQERNFLRELELYFQSREQDRQTQQAAIDRFYSSRNTGNIVGSISQAIGQIFGNRGGNVFGTPPTFPGGGGLGGFLGGLF
jgi:hypothetical protein